MELTSMLTAQTDLFAEPLIGGLSQADGFLTEAEEQALIAAIGGVTLSPFRYHEWLGKRLTASFGWSYDFASERLSPATPIPDWLLPVRARAARFAGISGDDLTQALLIRYDPGAGIGWHRDRPVYEHVVGLSLGSPTTMRFRRRRRGTFERRQAFLAPRSVYHLAGESRYEWEHSIPEVSATRWAITFRSLRRSSDAAH